MSLLTFSGLFSHKYLKKTLLTFFINIFGTKTLFAIYNFGRAYDLITVIRHFSESLCSDHISKVLVHISKAFQMFTSSSIILDLQNQNSREYFFSSCHFKPNPFFLWHLIANQMAHVIPLLI